MRLFLRTFADCEDEQSAEAIEARLLLALSALSPSVAGTAKPYWKLPHLFEFTFVLETASEVSFQAIVAASSGGWQHLEQGSELSSIWNRKNDHAFLAPEVRWAELQLYETAA